MKDIHQWLGEIGLVPPTQRVPGLESVTYHESCHLCHGQKVTREPRDLLKAIPGLDVIELTESNWCCGSAGIYNITQPEQSAKLIDRKMKNVRATGAAMVATSNPGCHLQLQSGGASVTQPVTLLAKAYRGGLESQSLSHS